MSNIQSFKVSEEKQEKITKNEKLEGDQILKERKKRKE